MISRSSGRSCVAAAAYIAGVKLTNDRDGQTHDYTKKEVAYSEIIAPSDAPEWAYNRFLLWNRVEVAEKRKDAQTAREVEFALPNELPLEKNIKICQSYADFFVKHGMVVDFSIHANKGNIHAHFLLTTREIYENGFKKKNRDWNTREFLNQLRHNLADVINDAIKTAGLNQTVSEKSFATLGKVQLPTVHEGYVARKIEKRGGISERCEINRQIKSVNDEVRLAKKDKTVCEKQLQTLAMQKKAIKDILPVYPWCRMIFEKDVVALIPHVSELASKGLIYLENEIKNLESLKSKLYDRPLLEDYVRKTFFAGVDERVNNLDKKETEKCKQYNSDKIALEEKTNKAKAVLMREEEYLHQVNKVEKERQASFIKRIFFTTKESRKKANDCVRQAKAEVKQLEKSLTELEHKHILEIERINLQRREVNALIFQEQRHKADQLALETVPDLAKMISCIDTALKKLNQAKRTATKRNDIQIKHSYSR